jgi:hypothetical protein
VAAGVDREAGGTQQIQDLEPRPGGVDPSFRDGGVGQKQQPGAKPAGGGDDPFHAQVSRGDRWGHEARHSAVMMDALPHPVYLNNFEFILIIFK